MPYTDEVVREPLPEALSGPMRMYNLGAIPMPQAYIAWHKEMALKAKDRLLDEFVVHATWDAGDGWFTWMRVVYLVVEHKKTEKLLKLVWHDGNQEFFQKFENHGGASPLRYWKPHDTTVRSAG